MSYLALANSYRNSSFICLSYLITKKTDLFKLTIILAQSLCRCVGTNGMTISTHCKVIKITPRQKNQPLNSPFLSSLHVVGSRIRDRIRKSRVFIYANICL